MLTVIWYEEYPFKYYLNCGSVNVLAKKEKKNTSHYASCKFSKIVREGG